MKAGLRGVATEQSPHPGRAEENESIGMKLDLFDYELPPERIAQVPARERDHSRLMRLDRRTRTVEHHRFHDLPDLLRPDDLLVVNDTRVMAARLFGRRDTGGKVEILLLKRLEGPETRDTVWEALVRGGRGLSSGESVHLDGTLAARLVDRLGKGMWTVSIEGAGPVGETLERVGLPPLPPYIRRDGPDEIERLGDRDRYQTIYARHPGAAAAPTAGLHFTEALFDEIRARGVDVLSVTLHVGLGTFLPVRVDEVDAHRMHTESYRIGEETARGITQGRKAGRRIVAVGTTTVRALESAADGAGGVRAGRGETELFIRPGYRFRAVDSIVTNFHLPKSTLLIMMASFMDREFLLSAYREAIEQGYRFYSYGDAMLIL